MGDAAKRQPGRPPRALALVHDPDPDEVGAPIDWSGWYLSEEDDVGQGPEQDDVVDTFASSVEQLLGADRTVRVGRDAFFAWVREEPNVRVSPDVYVLDQPPPPPWPKMWETWRPGHSAPRFALEVVGSDWKKDLEDAPAKYALLGVQELLIHDPEAARGVAPPKRVPLTLYRREADGAFVRVHAGGGPVRLDSLGAWAMSRPHGGVGWLRLARDEAGEDIVPTAAERADRLAARLRELGLDPDE